MDNDTLADYWRDVKPILKEQNAREREAHYDDRIEYAIYMKEGIVFDVSNCSEDGEEGIIYINGLDGTELDILYDLIKDGLVEKVENEKRS